MFSRLMDFGHQRAAKQAFGFYIAYLLISVLLGALSGGLAAVITGDGSFEAGIRVGMVVATVLCLLLGYLVASRKEILGSFKTVLIIILAGVLAFFFGSLGGMIPIAYLTTCPPAHHRSEQQDANTAGD